MKHDYRPVSLCNTSNKSIAQICVHRMRPIGSKIISPAPGAFNSGRVISYHIHVCHELIHYFKRKHGWLMMKLHLCKAYDRIRWCSISNALGSLGFSLHWIHLIHFCISSTYFQILVDGAYTVSFSPSVGIRQGDPLSPSFSGQEVTSTAKSYLASTNLISLVKVTKITRINHSFMLMIQYFVLMLPFLLAKLYRSFLQHSLLSRITRSIFITMLFPMSLLASLVLL